MSKFNTTKGAFRDALEGNNDEVKNEIISWLSDLTAENISVPADDDDPIIITHPK